MKVTEIYKTIINFAERMRAKRPDLYKKLFECKYYDEVVSIASEFYNWEVENGGQETLSNKEH